MFQFLRRISGSFLPRPDRPWRDDATSHAPTIGHKRRYSVIEPDDDVAPSTAKRTKSDVNNPDSDECEYASERESTSPVEGQDVKQVTKGVKEVELEDKEETEDPLSIQPEGVPLPDSPFGSPAPELEPEPEPEPEAPEPVAKSDVVEETKNEEYTEDKDNVAREDAGEDEAEDNANTEPRPITTNNTGIDPSLVADETTDLHDAPASLPFELEP